LGKPYKEKQTEEAGEIGGFYIIWRRKMNL
jgi:hypothetical protein